jgi:putative DNA modification/repair radical SAM protein
VDLQHKLAILADAAKYDASCASSGTSKRDSVGGRGIGSTEGNGICHSFAPDGRCISLLKVLLTNYCLYDCLYCINRVSSNVERARFSIDEVVRLTLDFYRRNCIEGLFLSSGIIRSADYTMERVVEVARVLREDHDFRGYIHLKTIPEASPELLARAGRYADRLSINIELPTSEALHLLAPEKNGQAIRRSMARLRLHIDEAKAESGGRAEPAPGLARTVASAEAAAEAVTSPRPATPVRSLPNGRPRRATAPLFAPAGQSTQMIIGADASDDRSILQTSATLYGSYRLRRVYYSAFSPIPDAAQGLPLRPPPLVREHRLYQADWLMRFYGFAHEEIVPAEGGMLSLDVDPKLAWALAHRERFPVDLNRAPRELLLRVPGLGTKSVARVLQARRVRRLRAADLERMHLPLAKLLPFVVVADHGPGRALDAADLARRLAPAPQQGSLFA